MRSVLLILSLLLTAVPAAAGDGDVSRCYTIADADARNYCRAVAQGDRSICATIADPNLRALCQAETG